MNPRENPQDKTIRVAGVADCLGSPVAAALTSTLFLLGDSASRVTGANIPVDGGHTAK